jgi:hypothetical protein
MIIGDEMKKYILNLLIYLLIAIPWGAGLLVACVINSYFFNTDVSFVVYLLFCGLWGFLFGTIGARVGV